MIAISETVGLAKRIMDDTTCLFSQCLHRVVNGIAEASIMVTVLSIMAQIYPSKVSRSFALLFGSYCLGSFLGIASFMTHQANAE